WYQSARVSVANVDGRSADVLIVNTEGARGTGVTQRVLLVIGWRGDRFALLLLESLSLRSSAMGNQRNLEGSYKWSRRVGKIKGVAFSYHYIQKEKVAGRHVDEFGAIWEDKLRWNEDSQSFYDLEWEGKREKEFPFFVGRSISHARVAAVKVD